LALLLFLAPAARAQDAPEQLLPAGTQLYFRWDGLDAHRPAYARTALGRIMAGDTGTLVTNLYGQIQEGLGALLTVEPLLRGASPAQLQKLQADAAEAARLLPVLGRNGFLLAVEERSLEPPQVQATLIEPGAGAKPDPLFGTIRLFARLAQVEVKETKVDGRAVSYLPLDPLRLAWWIEGKHAVVSLGTDPPEALVKALHGPGERLTANPLYQRLEAFHRFETSARAYIDAAGLVKLGATRGKEVARLLNDLGLDGLRSVVFYSGFEGTADRGVLELDLVGPRKGLFTLMKGQPFHLGDVPALPPDVVSWSMTNFDLGALYDVLFRAAVNITRIVAPDSVINVRAFPALANAALGTDLRGDLLGSLGHQVVQYNAPSEGPLSLGQTFLLKVKDAKKLQNSLEQFLKGIGTLTGKEIRLERRTYHGVEVREVHVQQQGFFFVPTYAIHQDWLVLSFFPQQVHGYLRRAQGGMRAWKPSPGVQESLRRLPQEFVSVSFSDPRPTINQLLSLAPLIGGLVDSFGPQVRFDVHALPNAQEVIRHLFPNVGVTTDDGHTLRMESRDSLALPFDLAGLDTYALFGILSVARVAF
jgi:hypothetical protein